MEITIVATGIKVMGCDARARNTPGKSVITCQWYVRTRVVWLVMLLSIAMNASAGDWDVTPRITVGTSYSDNIGLDSDNEESDLAGEINPGVSVRGKGGRLEASLDYRMQNVFFLDNTDSNSTNHELIADGKAELVSDIFFIDASSTIGQILVDANERISVGNVNAAGNRTDFYTYTLSPYVQNRLGDYANTTLRYTHDEVHFDDGASDGETNRIDARINSGRSFQQLSWGVNYRHQQTDRDDASNLTYRQADGNARYRVTNSFSFVGFAGKENNDLESQSNLENGTYWSLGGFWQPSRYYSIEATKGHNQETASFGLFPTTRTALQVSYRDRDVGTNPGGVWEGTFSHRTRRTNWNASYSETTTTEQELITETGFQIFAVDPITGEVNPDPQPGDILDQRPIDINTLSDEVLETRNARASFGMKTGKSGIRVTLFNTRRTGLSTQDENKTRGVTATWSWKYAPRTTHVFTGYWQRSNRGSDDAEDDFWYTQARLQHRLGRNLRASVEYRYATQDSSGALNDYTENRVSAALTATF